MNLEHKDMYPSYFQCSKCGSRLYSALDYEAYYCLECDSKSDIEVNMNTWISVEDSLPPYEQVVIIKTKPNKDKIQRVASDVYLAVRSHSTRSGEWWDYVCSPGLVCDSRVNLEITHWMELPK